MASNRVLLFGGSFNPIHHGHCLMARAAAERLGVQRTVLIPSARPPHKSRDLASAEHRLTMVQLAIAGEPGFEACDLELQRQGPSFTLPTVEEFRRREPDAEFFWLIGSDSIGELAGWHRIAELADLCTFATVERAGWDVNDLGRLAERLREDQIERIRRHVLSDVPAVGISATEVRHRVAEGRSIRWLVPEPVADHIARNGLYRGA